MATPILITGAAGRVGAIGRTVTELLLAQGKPVRAMVRNEDQRAQALRDMGGRAWRGGRSRNRCRGQALPSPQPPLGNAANATVPHSEAP
jgi:nucleoside-diphosphate-sugar epimerase